MELWQRREGRRLTVAAYRAIGGLQGALESRANEVLGTFNDDERETCRRIFLRLTQPGEGTEDTKRRASFGELVPAGSDAESVEPVISRLADARLITTESDPNDPGKSSVEVAHEALIRGWGQLREWVEADRAGLRVQHRLTEAAHEWDHAGREPSVLFAGATWPYAGNGLRCTASNLIRSRGRSWPPARRPSGSASNMCWRRSAACATTPRPR